VRDANKVSCFIYKPTGEIELIQSSRAWASAPPGVPTIAGLVPVTDIMSRDVICALADLSIESVTDLMVNNYIGCVPVVDDDGSPIGMITKRDLVEPMANGGTTAGTVRRTAGDAMLPIAFTLNERATVSAAAGLMAAEGLHHVPIVSPKGRLVGLVSSLDIVRWLARNDGVVSTSCS
jgi:CBS domain-containing protein